MIFRLIFYILMFISSYYLAKKVTLSISNKLIFKPDSFEEYNKIISNCKTNEKYIEESIITSDGHVLDACLYNSYQKPSYDNIIFLYSHGNSGSIGSIIKSSTIKFLSFYGSVFIYDYRGYGKSTGIPSDDGLFIDSRSAWNYLIVNKKVSPKKIILYGHSLGTSVTANLMHYLIDNSLEHPNVMMLQNAFYSIYKIANELYPIIGNFVLSKFDTNNFLQQIDNKSKSVKIYIIHSKDDKLINFNHGIELFKSIKNNFCKLLPIYGSHDTPFHTTEIHEHIYDEISNLT